MSLTKKCVAEFVGTMLLVVFGCGAALPLSGGQEAGKGRERRND
ncbi:MAG TPA: aquaporin [Candidatus Gallimonas intestinigallinarum]|uniref:Aquaporin n=1 Tax=Candidatus Gallimonas intestinigallinarum TaxID=2838604 RepID=A0A9D2IUP5_9FIRM|nr:aquaporin [Candidatus Gallimonas intestinigallinarum]